jgi:hypothetical protein
MDPSGGRGFFLNKTGTSGDEASFVLVSAETGETVKRNVASEDTEAIDSILSTLKTEPLDHATAPWPYDDSEPLEDDRDTFGRITFVRPSTQTGLLVFGGISESDSGTSVTMTDGLSSITVRSDAGNQLIVDSSRVRDGDLIAFQRWAESVRSCGVEAR